MFWGAGARGTLISLSQFQDTVGCGETNLFHILISVWTEQNKSFLQHPDYCISLVHVSCGRLWYFLYMFVALFLSLESSAYVWPWRLRVGEKSLRALQFDIYSGLSKWVWYLFVNVKLAYLIDFNFIVSGYPAEEAQDTQTPQTFV